MLAKEVMSLKPEFLPPSATLKQAADLMRAHDYGFIPVGENDKLIGAITDRDIAIKAVAEGWDPNRKTIKDIMHKGVYYCRDSDNIEDVIARMEQLQVRRLVVLNAEKRMIGIISLGDIATRCGNAELCSQLTEAVSVHP